MADDKNCINLLISKKTWPHIGTSRETLSRKLTSFERKGWIKLGGPEENKDNQQGCISKDA